MAPKDVLNKLKQLFGETDHLSPNEEFKKNLQKILSGMQMNIAAAQREVRVMEAMLEYVNAYGVEGPLNAVPKEQRGQAVLKVAEEMIAQGRSGVTTEDILGGLTAKRLDLAVMQPRAVIGNVLARSPKFRRLARNQFEWIGDGKK